MTKTDLPPEVRDRAAQLVAKHAAEHPAGLSYVASVAIVDAVTAVVAEEIKRPMEADMVSVLSESGDVIRENQRKLDEIVALHVDKDALQAQLDQSRKVYAEFVTGQHEGALARVELLTAERDALQARVEELEAEVVRRKRSTLAVLIRKGLVSERPSGPPFRTRRGADLIEWADRAGLT